MFSIRRLTTFALMGVLCLCFAPVLSAQEAQQDRGRGSRRGGPRSSQQDNQQGVQQGDGQDGQQGAQQGGPRDHGPGGPREGRGRDRGPDRGDRRDRGGPRTFTPEDRERFYSEIVDRAVERATDTYELSDEQQTQVRSRMEQLRDQQRAYSEQHRQEFDSIRTEMEQLRDSGAGFR
ncbi:MAG: hypothetical protein GX616_00625, partial [Planctomycetes bacterium]|nr:hypothetical protein [Planctomycetota bacterium]